MMDRFEKMFIRLASHLGSPQDRILCCIRAVLGNDICEYRFDSSPTSAAFLYGMVTFPNQARLKGRVCNHHV